MTREELEKAIKNGESVWYISDIFKKPVEIKVREHTDKFIDRLNFYGYTDKNGEKRECHIDNLYKTKSEAEHYFWHANVTRTEHLPFLTWEEFLKEYSFDFYSENHEWFTMYWNDVDGIVIESMDGFYKKTWDLTEENFYKAYDECVRLFKEEE